LISHRISQVQADNALSSNKKSFWQKNSQDAKALGAELFAMIDGSGERLQVELNNRNLETEKNKNLQPVTEG